jgi:hypothetical protein
MQYQEKKPQQKRAPNSSNPDQANSTEPKSPKKPSPYKLGLKPKFLPGNDQVVYFSDELESGYHCLSNCYHSPFFFEGVQWPTSMLLADFSFI